MRVDLPNNRFGVFPRARTSSIEEVRYLLGQGAVLIDFVLEDVCEKAAKSFEASNSEEIQRDAQLLLLRCERRPAKLPQSWPDVRASSCTTIVAVFVTVAASQFETSK